MRIKRKKRGVCELLLDFKMGTPNRPLRFCFFFYYLSVPTAAEIGFGQQFIHLTLYFCHFLLGSVLHLLSGTLGTEGVGRNKISAEIAQLIKEMTWDAW